MVSLVDTGKLDHPDTTLTVCVRYKHSTIKDTNNAHINNTFIVIQ